MMIQLFLLAASLPLLVMGNDDLVVTPEASGESVVKAVVELIQWDCIFKYDKLLMRRMAFVESQDGTLDDTYPPHYDGGIWMVDEHMFDATKTEEGLKTLEQEIKEIKESKTLLNIDWAEVTWKDLRKPLYSGLGARLYLQLQSDGKEIPGTITDQATFWSDYYRADGDKEYFIQRAESLEKGCKRGVDMIFVLDGSGSVGKSDFEKMLKFVVGVVEAFDIGRDLTQVGVVQFSSSVYEEFKLNRYDNINDLRTGISNINYRGGLTDTAAALKHLREVALSTSNGAREQIDAPHVAIVVTDGRSNNQQDTIKEANKSKEEDIIMMSVGVGSVDLVELDAIAEAPPCLNRFLMEGFNDFEEFARSIKQRSCDAPTIHEPGSGSNVTLPPGSDQPCKLKIPLNGATVKMRVKTGSVKYFVAKSTYPSEAYYDDMMEAGLGEVGVLYAEQPENQDFLYCNIKGDEDNDTNVDMDIGDGDQDWCDSSPCQNGGTCVDEMDKYVCHCNECYTGSHCETFVGYTCSTCSPCTQDNIDNEEFYHRHIDPTKFVQCDAFGGCYELDCRPGTVWNDIHKVCAHSSPKHPKSVRRKKTEFINKQF